MNRRTAWMLAIACVLTTAPAGAQEPRRGSRNEATREQWQRVDEILAAMQVKSGAVVADIGAGDGFFTTRLASAVGASGRVHAVDIGADALRRLRARVTADALTNVEVVEGTADDPKLPAGTLDAALIVNAYHEMTEHQAMLAGIKAALKPAGRLVIVEPITAARRGRPRAEQTRNHEIALDVVREDARQAGFAEVTVTEVLTSRPRHGDEWMLVLAPTPDAAQVFSAKSEAWKAPELRISVDDFKREAAAGNVLVLDVRDPVSFRQGHLPGAVLMTPEELSTPEGAARLKGEKRLIVAYCS